MTRIEILLDRIQQRMYMIRDLQRQNSRDRAEIEKLEKKGNNGNIVSDRRAQA
jgi:hypothetical protein